MALEKALGIFQSLATSLQSKGTAPIFDFILIFML